MPSRLYLTTAEQDQELLNQALDSIEADELKRRAVMTNYRVHGLRHALHLVEMYRAETSGIGQLRLFGQ